MSGISILLVDDHPVVRAGYRHLIERRPGFRVVAEADSAAEAYRQYRAASPDIVVMDLSLPGPGGIEAIRHIRQFDKAARILVFTMHTGAAFALKAFEAGASGYITKSSPPLDLVDGIDMLSAGRRAISPDIAREIAEARLCNADTRLAALSPRETEVLRLLALGHTSADIADSLNLSLKTIQNIHYRIKSTVNAQTDAQLVWLAIESRLLSVEECLSSSGRS